MFLLLLNCDFNIRCVNNDKNKNKSILFMICLFTIGLTMAQLLVEVASRYHYSATISMIILSAFGINYVYNKKRI